MQLLMLYVPCENAENAKEIANKLLAEKLIICANISSEFTSLYFWQEKIEQAKEIIMFLKIKKENLVKCQQLIQKHHSYEIPAIIEIPINANFQYLDYIKSLDK